MFGYKIGELQTNMQFVKITKLFIALVLNTFYITITSNIQYQVINGD